MAQGTTTKVKKRKKSVLKRARQYGEREAVNRANRTQMRSAIRKLRAALSAGDAKTAGDLLRPTLAALDHAITKGVLHENTGNRYKSRLALSFNALQTAKKA
jgi:small subunit ribosomal protein S20